jgi:hypothetical protein
MNVTHTDIIESIKEHIKTLPLMDERYYQKHLLYKEFHFQEERMVGLIDLLAKIQFTLTNNEEKYQLLLDKKLLEAQDSLINACNHIFSERIKLNPFLQKLVQSTIVPYYKGRFQISFSREISFLPLELRLYIYTQLLSIEASSIRQMHLMDRIALTLHKAGETFLGDCAVFISAWHKTKISEFLTGRKQSFTSCLSMELKSVQQTTKLRERILIDAEMTPEIAGQEFWYGFKAFSNLQSIHNIEAAKICLELFTNYFQNSFSLVNDIHSLLLDYYKTKNPNKINELIQQEGLDQVTIVKRYVKTMYPSYQMGELELNLTEKLDIEQKTYVQQLIENPLENSYLYINPTKKNPYHEKLDVPEEIAQHEAIIHIKNLAYILRYKRISLFKFNEYLLYLSSGMLNSPNWDSKILNIVNGALADIYSMVWLRNKESQGDIFSLLETLVKIVKEGNLEYQSGNGWPVALILEDGTSTNKKYLIFKSANTNFPLFTGHLYVGVNPRIVKHNLIEDEVRNNQKFHTYWERIEKNPCLTKTMKRKRQKGWLRLNKAREHELFTEE